LGGYSLRLVIADWLEICNHYINGPNRVDAKSDIRITR